MKIRISKSFLEDTAFYGVILISFGLLLILATNDGTWALEMAKYFLGQ